MKIAMLTNNYKPFLGGVPISAERQAKELVKLGHEVTVFAPEYDGELPEGEDHFDENGIRIFRYRTSARCMENGMVYPRLILKEITKVFEEESFDLIHTHHPMFVGMTALYLGRKYQLPVIYTYHTRYEDYLHYIGFLKPEGKGRILKQQLLKLGQNVMVPEFMRWFTNQCDLVLAPTAGMQKRIRENGTRTPMAVFPDRTGRDILSGTSKKKPEKSAGNIWEDRGTYPEEQTATCSARRDVWKRRKIPISC